MRWAEAVGLVDIGTVRTRAWPRCRQDQLFTDQDWKSTRASWTCRSGGHSGNMVQANAGLLPNRLGGSSCKMRSPSARQVPKKEFVSTGSMTGWFLLLGGAKTKLVDERFCSSRIQNKGLKFKT